MAQEQDARQAAESTFEQKVAAIRVAVDALKAMGFEQDDIGLYILPYTGIGVDFHDDGTGPGDVCIRMPITALPKHLTTHKQVRAAVEQACIDAGNIQSNPVYHQVLISFAGPIADLVMRRLTEGDPPGQRTAQPGTTAE